MKKISITSLGQLAQVDIRFGDMTVLVGPQASGKSIFLQLIKLAMDCGDISETMKKYGFDWRNAASGFLSLYFGTGMQGIWNDATDVSVDGKKFDLEEILSKRGPKRTESVFLIPAQRVMTLRNGWPRPFTDYETGDPYVVKRFSEHLRQLMAAGLGSGKGPIFPQVGRMDQVLRQAIDESIFGGTQVKLDSSGMRKRIVLDVGEYQLPFMVWSAGQREFVPLLLGLYWLMPASKTSTRKKIEWVVIEEPEMGLHPQAISALLVTSLELMHRGYKVIISTHSPQVLEMVWGIQILSQAQASSDAFLKLFDLPKKNFTQKLGDTILQNKSFKTYYFARSDTTVNVKDISSLEPGSIDEEISDWGGLTAFSTRVSEIVSAVA